MKQAMIYHTDYLSRPVVPYPNAATRRQLLNKFVDGLLIAAMGVACVTVFVFMLTL